MGWRRLLARQVVGGAHRGGGLGSAVLEEFCSAVGRDVLHLAAFLLRLAIDQTVCCPVPPRLAVGVALFSDAACAPKPLGRMATAKMDRIRAGIQALRTVGCTNLQVNGWWLGRTYCNTACPLLAAPCMFAGNGRAADWRAHASAQAIDVLHPASCAPHSACRRALMCRPRSSGSTRASSLPSLPPPRAAWSSSQVGCTVRETAGVGWEHCSAWSGEGWLAQCRLPSD